MATKYFGEIGSKYWHRTQNDGFVRAMTSAGYEPLWAPPTIKPDESDRGRHGYDNLDILVEHVCHAFDISKESFGGKMHCGSPQQSALCVLVFIAKQQYDFPQRYVAAILGRDPSGVSKHYRRFRMEGGTTRDREAIAYVTQRLNEETCLPGTKE